MLPHNYQNLKQFDAYVAEYKSLLDQQIKNNEENYNQNMLYIRTGQQITEMPDQRSLDEKMMDTQKILTELRPKLMTITDGVYTSQILNQLQENLNLLRFVYNSWPRIEKYFKTNFARGVTALIFMTYINEQVKVTTKEVGQIPYHIFRPKILEYSQQFLNDIINKGNLIKSKKLKTTFNTVLEDLKEKIRLYQELINEENNVDNSYMVEGMADWISQWEENQKGLLAKWEGIIEGAMIYQVNTEKELEQVINEYRDLMIVEDDLTVEDIRRLIKLMRDTYKKQQDNREKMFNMFDPSKQTNPDDYYSRFPEEPSGKQTTGKGLTARKPRQSRVKIGGSVLSRPKEPLYISFGTKIINKPDLNKGILKLRSAKGGALVKFDTQAISGDLAEVLKQIVAGDIPADNILDSLMDDDKQLLHKIISESRLTDKIKVPDVNYDKIDKDYRRFLLLRGETVSGNNNPQMIQELKRLIIKLAAAGRLPKAQSNAALQELAILDL
jgi:hypothetical protein